MLLLAPLLLASGSSATGFLPYLRPYIAAALVGVSMFSAPRSLHTVLCSAPARYFATISYAVYVLHGMLAATWLGSGDRLVKYAKRPLLFAMTVLLAHWSTFRYEQPMIERGKTLSRRFHRR